MFLRGDVPPWNVTQKSWGDDACYTYFRRDVFNCRNMLRCNIARNWITWWPLPLCYKKVLHVSSKTLQVYDRLASEPDIPNKTSHCQFSFRRRTLLKLTSFYSLSASPNSQDLFLSLEAELVIARSVVPTKLHRNYKHRASQWPSWWRHTLHTVRSTSSEGMHGSLETELKSLLLQRASE